jgi:sarcosine oxidase, subunit beta
MTSYPSTSSRFELRAAILGAMSERYDIAVIGAGVIGLSIARELGRAGARVVVLEREAAIGQGSSSRANGGIRAQFTTPINIAFSLYSISEFEALEAAHGIGLHQTGYLFFTGTAEGEGQLRAACELQRSLGVEVEWLEPAEIVARVPLVRPDGLRAGTFHGRDGFLDPHGVLAALKAEAQSAGATLVMGAGVERIEPGFEVATTNGDFGAEWVVNAAGAHARALGELAGVEVPVDPIRRNLAFIPDPATELIPMCVDLDSGILVRREVGGGYLIAYSDPDDEPGWETSVDPRFLERLAERIGERFPSLEGIPIDPHHCWAGLYPETADHHAIVGATDLDGFLLCVGFGGHGVMHAPAAGKAIAELITTGQCTTFDLHPLRPARFAEGDLVVEAATF